MTWAATIVQRLNLTMLPKDFEAEPRFRSELPGEIEEEITPQTIPESKPLTGIVELDDPDSFEVHIYRDSGRWKLAAAIELVSPANKDRESKRRAFATKCAAYLAKGVSVVVVDIITNRSANLHAELVTHSGLAESFAWESATGLSAISYRTHRNKDGVKLDVWPWPLTLGGELPTVPLWLDVDLCVPLELELTYHQACQSLRLA